MNTNFKTYELAKQFYKECAKLKLRSELQNQFYRASLSVVLNLAEGSGKPSTKEKKRFYAIAFGSIRECQAVLELIEDQVNVSWHKEKADHLAACIYKLTFR